VTQLEWLTPQDPCAVGAGSDRAQEAEHKNARSERRKTNRIKRKSESEQWSRLAGGQGVTGRRRLGPERPLRQRHHPWVTHGHPPMHQGPGNGQLSQHWIFETVSVSRSRLDLLPQWERQHTAFLGELGRTPPPTPWGGLAPAPTVQVPRLFDPGRGAGLQALKAESVFALSTVPEAWRFPSKPAGVPLCAFAFLVGPLSAQLRGRRMGLACHRGESLRPACRLAAPPPAGGRANSLERRTRAAQASPTL